MSDSLSSFASATDLQALSDSELDEFIDYWHRQHARYKESSLKLPKSDPARFRLGWSGYWCSKREGLGLNEKARRLHGTQ